MKFICIYLFGVHVYMTTKLKFIVSIAICTSFAVVCWGFRATGKYPDLIARGMVVLSEMHEGSL